MTYLGRLDRDDEIVRAYGASNVVVVPSRIENLPQVATEAQSCARAVLAFATTGLNDAVLSGKTGCLIPPVRYRRRGSSTFEFTFEPSILPEQFGENAERRTLEQWEPQLSQTRINSTTARYSVIVLRVPSCDRITTVRLSPK